MEHGHETVRIFLWDLGIRTEAGSAGGLRLFFLQG